MGKNPFDDDDIPYTRDLVRLLKDKSPRIAMAVAALQAAQPGIRFARSTWRSRRLYTIRVPGGMGSDGLYDELHEWVLSLLPAGKRKALIAYVRQGRIVRDWDSEFQFRERPRTRLQFRYDGSRDQYIQVRGARIKVTTNDQNIPGQQKTAPEIIFTATSEEARDTLVLEIEAILAESSAKSRIPVFRMINSFDDWETVDSISPRTLDSVILPRGQLERIIADITRFRASEEAYIRRCAPYHRGHLYSGEPGTCKTSTARAIASHFGMDVWYIPLPDIKKDSSLIRVVTNIRSNSLLLLEDIDIFHASTSREDDGTSTLAGLLNALDGIATPHGLITVMTANQDEQLEAALVRSGRADITERFTLSGPAEASRLVSRWYNQQCPELRENLEMSASDISEVCKSCDSAAEAAEALNGTAP